MQIQEPLEGSNLIWHVKSIKQNLHSLIFNSKITSRLNLKPCLSVESAMHFPKIHKSVLRKIKIDLFHFWDVYDVNLSVKEEYIDCTGEL